MAGRLFALLLPCECVLCAAPGPALLCAHCRDEYFGPAALIARCPVCANPLPAGHAASARSAQVCARCLRTPPSYDATLAACSYELPLDRLVLQLKFGARLAHGRLFGELLAAAAVARGAALPALLCPVPLGDERLAGRGFNQALQLARQLAPAKTAPRLLLRVRNTSSQSALDKAARRANVKGAFGIEPLRQAELRNKKVVLVDDVMTSGASLHAAAEAVKQAGAARVSALVLARTDPP